jgi:putative SOS response-associated peptidase YedK
LEDESPFFLGGMWDLWHAMVAYPVSRRVNDPKNDNARLIEPEAA